MLHTRTNTHYAWVFWLYMNSMNWLIHGSVPGSKMQQLLKKWHESCDTGGPAHTHLSLYTCACTHTCLYPQPPHIHKAQPTNTHTHRQRDRDIDRDRERERIPSPWTVFHRWSRGSPSGPSVWACAGVVCRAGRRPCRSRDTERSSLSGNSECVSSPSGWRKSYSFMFNKQCEDTQTGSFRFRLSPFIHNQIEEEIVEWEARI